MTHVAFIGIGAMGEPMVANLLKKGFSVTVIKHRRPEPAQRLQTLGAKVAGTAAEAAAGASIAILSLPTSREVDACVRGENGLAQTMAAGGVIVDCSTSNPQNTRELAVLLAERKIGLVDAGMTRGVAGAKQGNLAFFIGGAQAHIDQAMPALKAMGDTFLHQLATLGPMVAQRTSNTPAAPMPPPMHMVTQTNLAPRLLPSIRAWPVRRWPLTP